MRLFALPTGGEKAELLQQVETEGDLLPQWSPDGSLLAYIHDDSLYVISARDGLSRRVAQGPWFGTPRWSPDSKFVAALGGVKGDNSYVFVVPASGGELRRLTAPEEEGIKEGLSWHPDGQKLAYVRYSPPPPNSGVSELRQAYLDGRPSSLMFDRPDDWDYMGTWAPDGRHFFFRSARGEVWTISRYDAETGAFTAVANDTGVGLPSWSRDGKTMVWEVQGRVSQLYLMENFR